MPSAARRGGGRPTVAHTPSRRVGRRRCAARDDGRRRCRRSPGARPRPHGPRRPPASLAVVEVVGEVAVVVGPARHGAAPLTRRSMRGNSGAPFSTGEPARVAAPRRGVGQALVGRARPSSPMRLPDLVGGRSGSAGRGQDGDDAQHLEGIAHHRVDLGAGLDLPRLVRPRDGRWPRGRAATWRRAPRDGATAVPGLGGRRRRPSAATAASGLSGRGAGPDAVALLADDGRHPGQQVAEVVGQVGVVAGDHALVGEVAVGAERVVAQEVVAEPVDTEVGDEVGREDLVEAASWTSSRRRRAGSRARGGASAASSPGGQQHGRPVHAVEAQDVLADQVVDRRPPGVEASSVGRRSRPPWRS